MRDVDELDLFLLTDRIDEMVHRVAGDSEDLTYPVAGEALNYNSSNVQVVHSISHGDDTGCS
ncbi:MAG: hypothetical protein R2724_10605 [Bryobacterales bacterium]